MPPDQDSFEEQLSAYLDGELRPEEVAQVERRVAHDPEARARLDDLRRTVDAVRALPRRTAPAGLMDDLTGRIERDELLGGVSTAAGSGRGRRRAVWGLLASAAVVVFAVGGGFWVFLEMSESASESPGPVALVDREPLPLPAGESAGAELPDGRLGGQLDSAASRGMKQAGVRKSEPVAQSRGNASRKLETAGAREGTETNIGGAIADADVPADDSAGGLRGAGPTGPSADVYCLTFGEKPAGAPEATAFGRIRVAPMPPDQAAVALDSTALDPADPLDAKLRRGITVAGVLEHSFANEAMTLSVAYDHPQDRELAQQRLYAFMTRNRISPVEQVDADRPVLDEQPFFFEGEASRNFTDGPDARQVLVRLPASKLGALAEEVCTPQDGRMQLEFRPFVVATDPQQVGRMLSAAGEAGSAGLDADQRQEPQGPPGQRAATHGLKPESVTKPDTKGDEVRGDLLDQPTGELITLVVDLRAPATPPASDANHHPASTQPARRN